jgi:hypothetical protein
MDSELIQSAHAFSNAVAVMVTYRSWSKQDRELKTNPRHPSNEVRFAAKKASA